MTFLSVTIMTIKKHKTETCISFISIPIGYYYLVSNLLVFVILACFFFFFFFFTYLIPFSFSLSCSVSFLSLYLFMCVPVYLPLSFPLSLSFSNPPSLIPVFSSSLLSLFLCLLTQPLELPKITAANIEELRKSMWIKSGQCQEEIEETMMAPIRAKEVKRCVK